MGSYLRPMARTEAAAEAFDRDRKRAIERAGSPLTGEAISAPNTVILYFRTEPLWRL
jgi:hypothetical protein